MNQQPRTAHVTRNTKETRIDLALNIDGRAEYDISTTVPFFDHMLDLLAKHALFDLTIKASGDTEVDYHHLVEDVGIVLGDALNQDRLILLVGDFIDNDDLFPDILGFLDPGLGPHDDHAAAGFIRLSNSGPPADDAARRKVRPLDDRK